MIFGSRFRGGIHPNDHKKLTKDKPIKTIEPPKTLVFSMEQGGAPCTPTVAVGDSVLVGQMIGDSEAFVSAPVFSSVSGTVTAVEERMVQSGKKAMCVVVENDGNLTSAAPMWDAITEVYPDKATLIDIVRRAGIVGMGGAGFPTHVKLSTDKPIDTIIINAAECEPYLTADYRKLMEEPQDVIDGLLILTNAFGIQNGIIGIEDNKKDLLPILKPLMTDGIKIKRLKTKYPQGSEKQMIYAVTGKKVPEGGLPADVGVLVFNVDTASSISRAVRKSRPVTSRIVTLSGECMKEPGNYKIRTGSLISDVFDSLGWFTSEPKKIIIGGPMMGMSQYSAEVPVTKTTSGILALSERELGTKAESPCLRCGKCNNVCPMGLMPGKLSELVKAEDWDGCIKGGIMSCMECGSCAYICPADKNPISHLRHAKGIIRAAKTK